MAKTSKFERLVQKAEDAGKMRRYAVNPDVVALRVERIMTGTTILFWAGLVLGLGYTVPNVASFMGGGWGWFVSPAINAPLIALLLAGSIMARYDEKPSRGVTFAKFLLLGFEYGMNTWTSWASQDPAAIFKHSVPMVIVVLCAEGVTDLRAGLTRCVTKAYEIASKNTPVVEPVAEIAPEDETPGEPDYTPEEIAEIEVPPVVVEPAPVVVEKAEHYRPAGGKRAAQLAADMATMTTEFGDGVAFLMLPEGDRMKAVKELFSTDEQKCGNSRAYRLADEFSKKVEAEMRSEIG